MNSNSSCSKFRNEIEVGEKDSQHRDGLGHFLIHNSRIFFTRLSYLQITIMLRFANLHQGDIIYPCARLLLEYSKHYISPLNYIFSKIAPVLAECFKFCCTQVGISNEKRELLRKLNRIAETGDLSTSRGLIDILQGTLCNAYYFPS